MPDERDRFTRTEEAEARAKLCQDLLELEHEFGIGERTPDLQAIVRAAIAGEPIAQCTRIVPSVPGGIPRCHLTRRRMREVESDSG